MTEEQRKECAEAIDLASNAALAAGAVSEAAVIAVKVTMVMNLAAVFDVSISEAIATSIVNNNTGASIISEGLRWFFPPSRIVTAIYSADQMNEFGWKVAKDFDNGKYS